MRILIIANKTWECEPLLGVLLAKDGRPTSIDAQTLRLGYHPAERPRLDPGTEQPYPSPPEADGLPVTGKMPIRPRLSFDVTTSGGTAAVEVWCIEDWMRTERRVGERRTGKTVKASSSSSHEKFTFTLPQIRDVAHGGQAPDLVIAFGTAGIPADETLNGCVTVGSRVYIRDAWEEADDNELAEQVERFGSLLRAEVAGWLNRPIESSVSRALFRDIDPEVRHAAEARFLALLVHLATSLRILAGHGFASLGTLNISDYDDYVWADEETLTRFEKNVKQREIGSMETTHGLIRLTWANAPFLFVSALTDRVPMFNLEVTPRKYAQNFAPAHNAGVTLAFLLPELVRLHTAGKL